jgi:uncharacterized membrane protein
MSFLFAATHLGMSHEPYRGRLVDKFGAKGFQVVYSVVSLVTLGTAVALFAHNQKAGPVLWTMPGLLYPVVYLLMLLAFVLLVLSMRDRSPAMMLGGKTEPEGVLKVTRHPMNMAFASFGLAHIIANGTLGDIAFFGSLFAVGLFGSYHQDQRKVREQGEAYVAFQNQTGVIPFAAILQGKQKLEAKDLRLPFVIFAVIAFVAAIVVHEDLFGIRPY